VAVSVRPRRRHFLDIASLFHAPTVRTGAEWELLIPTELYLKAGPYLDRLRRRLASRRDYRLLRAILVENALATGQPDQTEIVLRVLERLWKRCPKRYLTWW
jgi:hypothetical protein